MQGGGLHAPWKELCDERRARQISVFLEVSAQPVDNSGRPPYLFTMPAPATATRALTRARTGAGAPAATAADGAETNAGPATALPGTHHRTYSKYQKNSWEARAHERGAACARGSTPSLPDR